MRNYLKQCLNTMDIEITDKQLDNFMKYNELLLDWNTKINLTAITEPEEVVKKHFCDSLACLSFIKNGATVCDVGTGAGFPGIPMLIARPDLDITLMDSTNKRLNVIRDILDKIGLSANVVHSRAEEAGKSKEFREKYDFSTARAVSNLRDLTEYCLPFVKVGGAFVSMKGAKAEEEIEEAAKAIRTLGGAVEAKKVFELEDSGERMIITIKKVSPTPPKFPRPSAKIAKNPLR